MNVSDLSTKNLYCSIDEKNKIICNLYSNSDGRLS